MDEKLFNEQEFRGRSNLISANIWKKNLKPGKNYRPNKADWLDGAWSGLKAAKGLDDPRRGETGVALKTLKEIGQKLTTIPDDFQHSQDHQAVYGQPRRGDQDRQGH